MKAQLKIDEFQIDERLQLTVSFAYNPQLVELAKSIGMRWNPAYRFWTMEHTKANRDALVRTFTQIATIEVSDALSDLHLKQTYTEKIRLPKELNEPAELHLNRFKGMLANKRYSASTCATYTSLLRKFFAFHFDRDPLNLNMDDVGDFNREFILENNYSINTQRQFTSALKLFYGNTEGHSLEIGSLVAPKKSRMLPTVLAQNQVAAIIQATANLKHRTIITTLYATGIRSNELLNIELSHIDSSSLTLNVVSGKGRKDRNIPLSEDLLELLRKYYKAYTPKRYLFEGANGFRYSSSSMNKVIKSSAQKAGIRKKVTCHTFRHSYATHLLESGVNLRYIQELLGHSSPKTTQIYTYVSPTYLGQVKSPLDNLNIDLLEPEIKYQKSSNNIRNREDKGNNYTFIT